ncbi:MAG: hypothetical protein AVDCRST_MAG51-3410 [uncultured Ramlibacter sp.]|uniref:Uncharacterized protein n=1 Tax=uncultured Ramlibacter sp. TaxID=260755 RepID=A0A6J4QEI7_9BURK|nr:MAG: hypothetical protein AVDCRST_MAG51-3410 [uncultured Ramlibacter sp.]
MEEQSPANQDDAGSGEARHGYRNEVNWEGGSGRQPYSNQGRREKPSPAAGEEFPQGNRAGQSGQNLDQLERVKQKP